jgi:hypothetical protein
MLHKAPDALFQAIDFLHVSWYDDPRCDQQKIASAERKCRTHGTTMKLRRVQEFRTMQLTEPIDDPELLSGVYRSCQIAHAWYCQTFLDGRFYLCSRPLFTEAFLQGRGQEVADLRRLDGIPLHEPDLRDRLHAYLSRTEPLESCRHCLGTVGKRIEWQQMPLAERRSAAPLRRRAEDSVSQRALTYLLGWDRVERWILRRVPSYRLARLLTLVKEGTMRVAWANRERRRPHPLRRLRIALSPSTKAGAPP